MTDHSTMPEAANKDLFVLPVTSTDIIAQIVAEKAQRAALCPANKAAVFAALAGAGIASVTVAFDGYGDSGQIQSVEARDALDAETPLPEESVSIVAIVWGRPEPEPRPMTLREAIEHLVYEALKVTHAGWEINDGSYGNLVLDVPALEIRLDYNERLTSSELYTHTF